MQRPVFYAIAIIITAYLPIFTLQRVEGRLFKPMAWTVAFALLGALMFSHADRAGARQLCCSARGTQEWHNPVMICPHARLPRRAVRWAIQHRWVTRGVARRSALGWRCIWHQRLIGSEFLPHLDEGAIWARGTLAPSTGPTEGIAVIEPGAA